MEYIALTISTRGLKLDLFNLILYLRGAVMRILLFIKNAGERLFGLGEAKATDVVAKLYPTPMHLEAANLAAASSIAKYVAKMNLAAQDLVIDYEGATCTVIVQGYAYTQEDKEKILLCCGNVDGVACVQDQLCVIEADEEPVFYTVINGDDLIQIAKSQYGRASAYMKIFEANKPMLSHPNSIYAGQMLRIPA